MRLDFVILMPLLAVVFLLPRLLRDHALPISDVLVRIDEQRASHILFRRNLLAVHLNVLSGPTGRILAAYPAGNSGAAAWIQSPKGDVTLGFADAPRAVPGQRGTVTFEVTVDRDEINFAQVVLGSVRSIREWDIDHLKPVQIQESTDLAPHEVTFHRRSLDKTHEYRLSVTAPGASLRRRDDGRVAITSEQPGRGLRLRVTTVTTEKPLTPIPAALLLKPTVLTATDPRSVDLLSFLLYKEKFLAGSWTYLTYFGRDTLLTLRFLMQSLEPTAIESMLGAVIDRVRDDGDVAHEEEIGDYAALRANQTGEGFNGAPRFEYRMVDDDFLLVPVLAAYFRHAAPADVASFLARRTPGGRTYRDVVDRNVALIERRTQAFTREPTWRNLIAFPTGQPEGNWRDSHSGVGWGRYAYDVNAALVPAALTTARIVLAHPAFGARDEVRLGRLLESAQVWQSEAPKLFRIHVARDVAEREVERYMRGQSLNVPPPPGRAVVFNAIALDEKGKAVPIMHSDEGFTMMFGDPPEDVLVDIAELILAPFPYGLRTKIGMVVANPAFAEPRLQRDFTAQHYHGTVVWSWQQAMMAAALRRQLERSDLSTATRERLAAAEQRMWEVIEATAPFRSAELWTWRPERGEMSYIPFGQNAGDHSESNPNQGWSHAFIGVRPPPADDKK